MRTGFAPKDDAVGYQANQGMELYYRRECEYLAFVEHRQHG